MNSDTWGKYRPKPEKQVKEKKSLRRLVYGKASVKLKTKRESQSVWEKKVDKEFSIFIRTRYANEFGIVQCFTCPKRSHWKQMDCGHYWGRKHLTLRYHEKNCEVQCRHCNRFCEGNKPAFTIGLIKKHGEGILEELEIKKNNKSKMGVFELQVLFNHYKQQNGRQ